MDKYDVIVLGAGPAGATAARCCAEKNLKTLLLEKDTIPREKRCAGGVSNGAIAELGFSLPEEIIERRCRGMMAVQGKIRNQVKSADFVATMVTRSKFDAFLTSLAVKAGAELRAGEPCDAVKREAGCVKVITGRSEYSANIVIGADGVYSKVTKLVRPPFCQNELRYCIIAEIPMTKAEIDKFMPDFVELHYGYIDMGYAWLFPKKDYISAGVAGAFKQGKGLKENFIKFLALHKLDTGVKLKGCLIPMTDFKNNIFSDRLMLAGDAGGLVDCFSGEGIRFAVASGKMAAATAAEAHQKNDFNANCLKSYQDRFYAEFRDDLKVSASLTRYSFRFPNLLLGTLIINNEVIQEYYKVMSGKLSFKKFAGGIIKKLPYYLLKRIFTKP